MPTYHCPTCGMTYASRRDNLGECTYCGSAFSDIRTITCSSCQETVIGGLTVAGRCPVCGETVDGNSYPTQESTSCGVPFPESGSASREEIVASSVRCGSLPIEEAPTSPLAQEHTGVANAWDRPYVSIPLFFWSWLVTWVGGTALMNGLLVAGGGTLKDAQLPLFVIGYLAVIYGGVLMFVLFYKMWKSLPPSVARTTPEKAVGFLFIPLFNFYWMFQVLEGWAEDFNRYVEQRQLAVPRVSERVANAVCLIAVIGGILGFAATLAGASIVGMLVVAPNLVLFPLFVFQTCTALNALPHEVVQAACEAHRVKGQTSPSLGVASFVLGILGIVTPYLGMVLGVVAIVLGNKQRKRYPTRLATAGRILGFISVSIYSAVILLVAILFIVNA